MINTLGFDDNGTPSVIGGNINTGTVFTIGDLQTTSEATGFFAGLPNAILRSGDVRRHYGWQLDVRQRAVRLFLKQCDHSTCTHSRTGGVSCQRQLCRGHL